MHRPETFPRLPTRLLIGWALACSTPSLAGAQGVRPGDDFFTYANAAWLQATEIPAGQARWTARNEIEAATRLQVVELFRLAAAAPAGSLARKVADFLAAWLDEAAIEARGLAALRPRLDSIEAIGDKTALARLLGRWMPADVDPLNWGVYQSSHVLGLSVEPGLHGEPTNLAFVLQGGTALSSREQYLAADSASQAVRAGYEHYIAGMLGLAGFDQAERRAAAVLALETGLAQAQVTPEASASEKNADNRWARQDFSRLAPGMEWPLFFAAAGLERQDTFTVWQPTAVIGLAAQVASQPLEAWKDYLRFHLLHLHGDLLPRAFREFAAGHAKILPGQANLPSREERALAATRSAMSEAVGRLYVEHYFSARQKARVNRIAQGVIAALARRVERLTWMAPESRAMAVAKLKGLYFGVGYPDRWQNYEDVTIDPADPIGNRLRIERHDYRLAMSRLGQPVDRRQWWMTPQTVGAVLLFQQNAYNFPAALLQLPKYDSTASDAANFGAIGAIIGHEASHFIDWLGKDYDATGAMRGWWTPGDSMGYRAMAGRLIDQYSAYQPFPDALLNGRQMETENVADLAGLVAAFDAYRETLGDRRSDSAYVREQDREFFLGFAASWRSKATEAGLRSQIATDSHAPDSYRIATVRNLDAWYSAFDVRPGQRLYLEPSRRVKVWE